MQISKHRLDVTQIPTFIGPPIDPEIIVIHYTAGSTYTSSARWLAEQKYLSAHLIIGRKGEIVQLVPFNAKAYHAGESLYDGRENVNMFSIGIEFANWGVLQKKGPGRFESWANSEVPLADVSVGDDGTYWETYQIEQIDAAIPVVKLLIDAYGIQDIVGHQDVAPGRKVDPGPFFPMDRFKDLLKGEVPEVNTNVQAFAEIRRICDEELENHNCGGLIDFGSSEPSGTRNS